MDSAYISGAFRKITQNALVNPIARDHPRAASLVSANKISGTVSVSTFFSIFLLNEFEVSLYKAWLTVLGNVLQ